MIIGRSSNPGWPRRGACSPTTEPCTCTWIIVRRTYAKVLLDALFGRECFLNEIIWAYDYGAKSKSRWPTKHDTILVYVKNLAVVPGVEFS
jgi:hypothetical protein